MHALDCPAIGDGARLHPRTSAPVTSPPPPTSATSSLPPSGTSSRPVASSAPPAPSTTTTPRPGTVDVASKTPAGDDIPAEPDDHAGDPLQIPASPSDGSHILMAAGGIGPCGLSNCPSPPCGSVFGGRDPLPDAAAATSTCGSTTPSPTTSPRGTTSTTSA